MKKLYIWRNTIWKQNFIQAKVLYGPSCIFSDKIEKKLKFTTESNYPLPGCKTQNENFSRQWYYFEIFENRLQNGNAIKWQSWVCKNKIRIHAKNIL